MAPGPFEMSDGGRVTGSVPRTSTAYQLFSDASQTRPGARTRLRRGAKPLPRPPPAP